MIHDFTDLVIISLGVSLSVLLGFLIGKREGLRRAEKRERAMWHAGLEVGKSLACGKPMLAAFDGPIRPLPQTQEVHPRPGWDQEIEDWFKRTYPEAS